MKSGTCGILLSLAVVAAPGLGNGADNPRPVAVGDPSVSGRALQPYYNAWIYSAVLPDGSVRVQGVWTDNFQKIMVDGKPALKRLQGMTYVNHQMSSVSDVFDASTCAPISNEQHHPNGSVLKRVFHGRHVTTERIAQPGGPSQSSDFDLPETVFDFYGGTYGVLLSCLPLRVGYSASFPAIDETHDVAKPVTLSVLREETIPAGSKGTAKTLVVLVDTPGEYTQTFWLSRTAPYIIRLRLEWADKHATAQFDMI